MTNDFSDLGRISPHSHTQPGTQSQSTRARTHRAADGGAFAGVDAHGDLRRLGHLRSHCVSDATAPAEQNRHRCPAQAGHEPGGVSRVGRPVSDGNGRVRRHHDRAGLPHHRNHHRRHAAGRHRQPRGQRDPGAGRRRRREPARQSHGRRRALCRLHWIRRRQSARHHRPSHAAGGHSASRPLATAGLRGRRPCAARAGLHRTAVATGTTLCIDQRVAIPPGAAGARCCRKRFWIRRGMSSACRKNSKRAKKS